MAAEETGLKSIRDLIALVQTLDAEASKGPWRRNTEYANDVWHEHGSILYGLKNRTLKKCMGSFQNTGDAEFVAEARTLLPQAAKMLEEVVNPQQEILVITPDVVESFDDGFQKGMEEASKMCEGTERFYGDYHAKRIRAQAGKGKLNA